MFVKIICFAVIAVVLVQCQTTGSRPRQEANPLEFIKENVGKGVKAVGDNVGKVIKTVGDTIQNLGGPKSQRGADAGAPVDSANAQPNARREVKQRKMSPEQQELLKKRLNQDENNAAARPPVRREHKQNKMSPELQELLKKRLNQD